METEYFQVPGATTITEAIREIAREEIQKVLERCAYGSSPTLHEKADQLLESHNLRVKLLKWLDRETSRLNAARYDEKTPGCRPDWLWGQVTALHSVKDFIKDA